MAPAPSSRNDDSDARLRTLLRAAGQAPLPPAADRLAIGFGARAEARWRAASLETAAINRLLWRWVTGLGACAAAVAVAASFHAGSTASGTAAADTSFQAEWTSYTQVPDVWPQ